MKKDDLYNSNGSSNTPNNRSKRKSSISSNNTDSFKMIDINVNQSKKDIDDIFSYTQKSLDKNSKLFKKSNNDIFRQAQQQSESFFKNLNGQIDKMFTNLDSRLDKINSSVSMINKSTSDNLNSMYDQIDRRHATSIKNRLSQEQALADNIDKLYKEQSRNIQKIVIESCSTNSDSDDNDKEEDLSKVIYSFADVLKDEDKRGINTEAYVKNLKSGIIDAIVAGGKKVVNIWTNRFESGIDNIVNTYESTFHEVATLTDTTSKDYGKMQNDMKSYLNNNNLSNVLKISDLMKGLDDVVKSGIADLNEAQSITMQDSITKAINPYIDTTADAYKDLQLYLGDSFVNSANNIVKAVNNGTTGTSRFLQKNFNEMLSQFEPVIANARSEQFDKQFAEISADIEAMVQAGMSSADAEKLKQSMYSVSNDAYSAITSGNVSQAQTAIQSLQNGDYDSGNIQGIFENLMKNTANNSKGNDFLTRNISGNELAGGTFSAYYDSDKLQKFIDIMNKTNSKYDKNASKDSQKDLASKYTAKQKKDTSAENKTLPFAKMQQWYPDTTKILKTIVGELKNIFLAITGNYIANKIISKGIPGIKKLGPTLLKGLKSGVSKGKLIGSETKELAKMFVSDVKSNGLKNASKEYAEVFLKDSKAGKLFSKGKSSLKGLLGISDDATRAAASSADDVAKAAGAGSKLAKNLSILGVAVDAGIGAFKSKKWLGKNATTGDKVKSAFGGAIGGSEGLGNTSIGSALLNAGGNAFKWGAIGTAIGGPIGTAVGATAGAVTGLIGGDRIAKVADKIPALNIAGKHIDTLKTNLLEFKGEVSDIWKDDNMNLGQKMLSTVKTASKDYGKTVKDWIYDFKEGYEDSIVGDGLKSLNKLKSNAIETFSDIGSNASKKLSSVSKKASKSIDSLCKSAVSSLKSSSEKKLKQLKKIGNGINSIFKSVGKAASKVADSAKDLMSKATEKTSAKTTSRGSHASGLNSVPYDGYKATLHKGETVFNRNASEAIHSLLGINGTSVYSKFDNPYKKLPNSDIISHSITKNNDLLKTIAMSKPVDHYESSSKVAKAYEGILDKKLNDTVAKTSELSTDNTGTYSDYLDTSNLEKAIYAVGDRIVSAINKSSKHHKNNLLNKSNGTVNVNFNKNAESDDLTYSMLPI